MTPSHGTFAEEVAPERLDWQHELDSALADIDSRLQHPRRRPGDEPPPASGQIAITPELIDELAWRVGEQLRRTQPAGTSVEAPAPAPAARPASRAPLPPELERPRLPRGVAVSIRIRKPLFRFRFWRRRVRRESLISFADYRV